MLHKKWHYNNNDDIQEEQPKEISLKYGFN